MIFSEKRKEATLGSAFKLCWCWGSTHIVLHVLHKGKPLCEDIYEQISSSHTNERPKV